MDASDDESDALDDLIDILREQREAMKERDADDVDSLMREMQDVFFDVQTLDADRDQAAKKLAAVLGCEPYISSISAALEPNERVLFDGVSDRLANAVLTLKGEMKILTGLIEHNERYTAMLVSEWRRISGADSADGAANFRG